MKQRDRQPELMDDPALSKEEHQQALRGLTRLNRFSGVSGAMYRRIRDHATTSQATRLRVLDVASGAGDLPVSWAKRARKDSIKLDITTVDISPTAIDQQRAAAAAANVSIEAIQMDCLKGNLPSGFDVVTCSLFMHHLDNHQVFCLLQSMQQATESSILVCDLHRSRMNLALVSIASRLVTRSPIVHYDAAASVRAAFTADEFSKIAEDALVRPVNVQPMFPCRFLMSLDRKVAMETEADAAVAFA